MNIENLKPISVIKGIGSVYREYRGREYHALCFKLNGSTRYVFNGKNLIHGENKLIFIPKGASYTVELLSKAPSYYLLINFEGDVENAAPAVYSLENLSDISFLCSRIEKLQGFFLEADRFRCMSLIYEILSLIEESESHTYLPRNTYGLIEPAVRFLNENLFNPALKIGELHLKAGVSDTYFRKVFASRFGLSPKKYVINKRLAQAKAIINNGEYNSIGEVALLCGFDDPLYFSKAYKARYGASPSKGKEQNT